MKMDNLAELQAIRHDLHAHPELCFEEFRTAKIIAGELARLGIPCVTGVAGTGVVATISKGTGRRAIAIRADMDALPIHETTNLKYASRVAGRMHACGHDGHTTVLLGTARHLLQDVDFDGTVHLIFQPAEEDISGAKRMVDEGLFKTFPCDAIFALHNIPGDDVGQVTVRPGAITAAVDIVEITIRGVGGHGAIPHRSVDPIVAASGIVLALQSIVARNVDPLDSVVITVGAIHAGSLATIIPSEVALNIGVRTCTKEMRELVKQRIIGLVDAQAKSYGCLADISYNPGIAYPAGHNAPTCAAMVRDVALALGQDAAKVDLRGPYMFSEDFAFMQEVVPSCYFGMGNGPSRNLHDAGYDFNDVLLEQGTVFWGKLVKRYFSSV
jgi:hippurate hydrolase